MWVLLAFALGCLLPLGFAPFNYWWFSLIAAGCFPLVLGHTKGFIRGWAFGAGVYISGVSWVYVSLAEHTAAGALPAGLATAVLGIALGLFFALLGFLYQGVLDRYRTPFTMAMAWVAMEWIRSWMFTGFPWLYLGYSALESPLFSHWIPIVGVYGCSFVMGLWAVYIAKVTHQILIKNQQLRNQKFAFVVMIALPVLNVVFGQFQWTQPTSETLKVALVQGNIAQADKWDDSKAPMINQRYTRSSKLALDDGADLIIWPEAAIPHLYTSGQPVIEEARQLLRRNSSASIVAGILTDDQPNQIPTALGRSRARQTDHWPVIRNSVLLIEPRTANDRFYHKQRLVPFGEYMPFADHITKILPFLESFQHGITAGPSEQLPFVVKRWSIQPLICYEIAFPGLAFEQAWTTKETKPVPVDAILTISNDAWFGLSHGPAQHFEMARFRAAEFGRPVIRATNTGITGVIDSNGDVLARAPRQQQARLFHELQKMQGVTPYAAFGPHKVLLCILALWIISLIPTAVRSLKDT